VLPDHRPSLVRSWQLGRKRLAQETKTRKRDTARSLTDLEEKKREKDAAVINAKEEVENVAERRRDFEAGAPFHEHRINSVGAVGV